MGRCGGSSVSDARVINRFALSKLLPVFLFNFSAKTAFADVNPLPILTYLSAESCVFIAGFLLATKSLNRSAAYSILLAMSAVIANTAFYVLAISFWKSGLTQSFCQVMFCNARQSLHCVKDQRPTQHSTRLSKRAGLHLSRKTQLCTTGPTRRPTGSLDQPDTVVQELQD